MLIILTNVLLRNQKDPCGWLFNNRIWYREVSCGINESWNLQSGWNGVPTGLDLSVVNAGRLFQEPRQDKCIFSVVGLKGAGNLTNGVLVINTTIDLSQVNAT